MTRGRVELSEYLAKHTFIENESDVFGCDCENIICLLDSCELSISSENTFFVRVNCEGLQAKVIAERMKLYANEYSSLGLSDAVASLAFTGEADFGHTSTDWKTVIELGIYGIYERLKEYRDSCKSDPRRESFYASCTAVWDAALRFILRAAEKAAECGRREMAEGLKRLSCGAPSNLFEAMQTVMIYYALQHIFEGTNLRTLGRLDSMLCKFYLAEDRVKADQMLDVFFAELDSYGVTANLPFALCGSDENGNAICNRLSYSLLEAYRRGHTRNIKLHILCALDTPEDIIELAMECIREGKNSIVFMSDEKIIESLLKLGARADDAANYQVVGCYECGAREELTCSCNARVNLPKALEVALNKGRDMQSGKLIGLQNDGSFESFEELFSEFKRQLLGFVNGAMAATDIEERNYRRLHSAPILSAVYSSSLKRGGDIYCDSSARYCNSSINALGLATVTDSLAAIKQLVYDSKRLKLKELVEILRNNWDGQEKLRLTIKNKLPKYGNANEEVDQIAKSIVDLLDETINGRPNAKGGVYRLGTFSIDWRWSFGRLTAASADGRRCGEPISQNTSASFGADKNGLSAHMRSASYIDTSKTPNGSVADIDLHSSTVSGENGLKALCATLRAYFSLGGFAVHYNILDTKALEKAKKCPEAYPELQVRLCGWNVLFSSLSEREKDEFIARSRRE